MALVPAVAAAEVEPGRLWTYQYLLVTANTEWELAPITDHIVHDPDLQAPEIGDFAAEVLLARYDDQGYPWKNKMRLIRVIAAMKSARYKAVLDAIESKTSEDDEEERKEPDSKLRRYAGTKIAASTETPVDPYVPGTISLEAQRAKYPSLYPESTFQSGRL